MKLGSREICDVVFRAKSTQKIGNKTFYTGQPVLVLDTAKTSTLEGDSETTYATGGRGNSNLIAWDGSKTITFTVEDALISPIGLSILMGADIADTTTGASLVHVHKMARFTVQQATASTGKGLTTDDLYIDLEDFYKENANNTVKQQICMDAPLFACGVEADNSITGDYLAKGNLELKTATTSGSTPGYSVLKITAGSTIGTNTIAVGDIIHLDFYVTRPTAGVTEIQVRKDKFAGYFYVEAETLYRRQDSGADLPAVITIPKVKIQSNFSFSMSADGDPSTFTFTMDAFPDKTYFDQTKEVLVVLQIIDDDDTNIEDVKTVMGHSATESILYNSDGEKYGYSDSYIGSSSSEGTANPKPKYDRDSYNS